MLLNREKSKRIRTMLEAEECLSVQRLVSQLETCSMSTRDCFLCCASLAFCTDLLYSAFAALESQQLLQRRRPHRALFILNSYAWLLKTLQLRS